MNEPMSHTKDFKNIKDLSSGEHSLKEVIKMALNATSLVCPRCHLLKSNKSDVDAINYIGVCLSCDHILNDVEVKYE